jgi:hypothetical protein
MEFVFPHVCEHKTRAIKIRPANPAGYYGLGRLRCCTQLGLDRAVHAFTLIIRRAPPDTLLVDGSPVFAISVDPESLTLNGQSAQLAAFLALVHGAKRRAVVPRGLRDAEVIWATGAIEPSIDGHFGIGGIAGLDDKMDGVGGFFGEHHSEARYFVVPRLDLEKTPRAARRVIDCAEFITEATDPANRDREEKTLGGARQQRISFMG